MPGAGSDDIALDLDPAAVLKALQDMKAEFTSLADHVESQLGRKAPEAIDNLEKSAKDGTSKITTYFRNLGTRVREDLKTAFDATGVLAGAKFTQDLGAGVKQVFEMERAFDRLNSRLRKSATEMASFKKEVGRRVANTGADLGAVLPGVETAAARGGVTSTGQLANIAESLGRVNQTTGEDTASLADTVVEILKNQGERVTDSTFKSALDALQGTRAAGAFTSAEEAGRNIESLSKYAPTNGLSIRELGGLSATASKAGSQGNNILEQLMQRASQPGGKQYLNDVFGQQIFGKDGKLDAGKIGNINVDRLGQYSQQALGDATGLQGASGADLRRFVEAFRGNMGDFQKVVSGANETATQFDIATDNLASKIDRFKQNVMRSTREIGEDLSRAGGELLKGNLGKATGALADAGGKAYENKGTLGAAAAITGAVGMLAGGSINRLLGKVGGGVVKGAAAKAAGVEPVYVVNAAEIGSGLSGEIGESFSSKLGALFKGGKFGALAAAGGTTLAATAAVGAASYGAGYLLNKGATKLAGTDEGVLGGKLYDWMYPDEDRSNEKTDDKPTPAMPTADAIGQAVAQAFQQAGFNARRPEYINKSAVQGTGKAL